MSSVTRLFFALLLFPAVVAEDATLPYEQLYKLCRLYPDSLMIKMTCQKEFQEPLKITIQTRGIVVSEVRLDDQGLFQLPLNEQWISDHAVIHANRPKGTMTMTAMYVAYPFSKFSISDGAFDIMEYLAAMKRSKDEIPRLQQIFKGALDTGVSESIPFKIDPPEGAKAILHYTVNGVERDVTFTAIDGVVVVRTTGLSDATAASVSVVPKDARIVFQMPEKAKESEPPIIP